MTDPLIELLTTGALTVEGRPIVEAHALLAAFFAQATGVIATDGKIRVQAGNEVIAVIDSPKLEEEMRRFMGWKS